MRVPFAERAYSNGYGLPPARLVNMFAEKAPGLPVQDARLPRPGLASAFTLGTGPNRGMFSRKGVFGGALFLVSGTTLYTSDGTVIGTIPGTDFVRFDASATQLVMVSSGLAYLWDGTTFGQITDPDLPAVVDVAFMAGRFVYARANSGRFYWSEIADAGNIAGLNFANAESSPDNNTGLAVLGDQLAIYGGETVEFWSATSDGDNPFQKNEGTRYQKGTPARDAIVAMDNAHFFVGNDRVVYRTGSVPERVSDHGIEEKLRRCTSVAACTAFNAVIEGHAWYVLNLPGIGTYAYDVSTQLWAEWKSFNHLTFRGCAAATVDGTVYIGDDTNSTIWSLAVGTYLDGADPISFLASAYVPNPGSGPIRCDRIRLDCVRGVGVSGPPLTQLLVHSNDFADASWTKTNATITTDGTLAPNGSTAGILRRTATGGHSMFQTVLVASPNGRTWKGDIWLKAGTLTGDVAIRVQNSDGSSLIALQVTPTGTWTNYVVQLTVPANATAPNIVLVVDPVNDAGSAGDTLYVAQAELFEVVAPAGAYGPTVEMRYSDDQGRTWSDWRQGTLGKIGEYLKRAYWNRLGLIKPPGRMFEFRSTDPVNTVFAAIAMNERA